MSNEQQAACSSAPASDNATGFHYSVTFDEHLRAIRGLMELSGKHDGPMGGDFDDLAKRAALSLVKKCESVAMRAEDTEILDFMETSGAARIVMIDPTRTTWREIIRQMMKSHKR